MLNASEPSAKPLRSHFSAARNRWPLVVGSWPEYKNHGGTECTEEYKEEKVYSWYVVFKLRVLCVSVVKNRWLFAVGRE